MHVTYEQCSIAKLPRAERGAIPIQNQNAKRIDDRVGGDETRHLERSGQRRLALQNETWWGGAVAKSTVE